MHRKHIPTTYDEARRALKGRTSRIIANNTTLVDQGEGVIGLRLHSTFVVVFDESGHIILNTGGWHTVTTKDRLNRVARAHGWNIYAEKRVWHIADRGGAIFQFEDGFTIPPPSPYVSAIIKGNRLTAARAAATRGIPAAFLRETANRRETVIRMGLEHRDAVARWFAEPVNAEDGACLLFSVHPTDHHSDAAIENHGTIFLVRPLTEDTLAWLTEHTDGTWFGGALAVEHRCASDLVAGLRDAGFVVEAA